MLQVGRRLRHDLLAGLGLAGESNLADLGVLDQLLAHHRAGADHDVEDTGRKTTLVHQLDEADRGKRGAAGRLGDHGVPDGEGGRDLVGQQGEREVPGDDRAHDTQRAPDDQAIGARHRELDVLAPDRAGRRQHRVELDVLHEALGLDLRIAQRLALFAREQGGDLVEVLPCEGRALHQDLRALLRQCVGPAAERCVGRVDCLPGFLDAGLRDRVDALTGRGVVDLHSRAGTRRRGLAVNHHRAHVLPFLQLTRAN